jgi:hypothetical protein
MKKAFDIRSPSQLYPLLVESLTLGYDHCFKIHCRKTIQTQIQLVQQTDLPRLYRKLAVSIRSALLHCRSRRFVELGQQKIEIPLIDHKQHLRILLQLICSASNAKNKNGQSVYLDWDRNVASTGTNKIELSDEVLQVLKEAPKDQPNSPVSIQKLMNDVLDQNELAGHCRLFIDEDASGFLTDKPVLNVDAWIDEILSSGEIDEASHHLHRDYRVLVNCSFTTATNLRQVFDDVEWATFGKSFFATLFDCVLTRQLRTMLMFVCSHICAVGMCNNFLHFCWEPKIYDANRRFCGPTPEYVLQRIRNFVAQKHGIPDPLDPSVHEQLLQEGCVPPTPFPAQVQDDATQGYSKFEGCNCHSPKCITACNLCCYRYGTGVSWDDLKECTSTREVRRKMSSEEGVLFGMSAECFCNICSFGRVVDDSGKVTLSKLRFDSDLSRQLHIINDHILPTSQRTGKLQASAERVHRVQEAEKLRFHFVLRARDGSSSERAAYPPLADYFDELFGKKKQAAKQKQWSKKGKK